MIIVVLRRTVQAVGTLLGAAVITFLLLAATPGEPAERILRAKGRTEIRASELATQRAEMGLDDPLLVQLWNYLTGMSRGDFGKSWSTGRSVVDEIAIRLPATLRLAAAALVLAIVLSLVLGFLSSWAAGRWPDHITRAASMVFLVIPSFMLGVLALDIIVVQLGFGKVISDGSWGTVLLPAFTLAVGSAASWARILRTTMLEARSAPFLLVSRARGASRWRRMWVHELPNALPPYVTIIGIEIAFLLGGAPIVESVYTWPGVGRFTVQAVEARDMPVVVAFVMIAVAAFVVAGVMVDLVNAALDPRRRDAR